MNGLAPTSKVSAVQAGPLPKLKYRIQRIKMDPIKTGPDNFRKFDSIVHFQEPSDQDEVKSLFGGNDVIYLTKKSDNTKRNILLDIVEQRTRAQEPRFQDNSDVMKLFLGMKRGLRRYGEPNFVYDFNELVTK